MRCLARLRRDSHGKGKERHASKGAMLKQSVPTVLFVAELA